MNPVIAETGDPLGCARGKRQYRRNEQRRARHAALFNASFVTPATLDEGAGDDAVLAGQLHGHGAQREHLELLLALHAVALRGVEAFDEVRRSPLPRAFVADVCVSAVLLVVPSRSVFLPPFSLKIFSLFPTFSLLLLLLLLRSPSPSACSSSGAWRTSRATS